MLNSGHCPKCEKTISSVKIETLDIIQGFESKWLGVSYVCVHCNTVLGVGIDPVALKTDTINGVLAHLRK